MKGGNRVGKRLALAVLLAGGGLLTACPAAPDKPAPAARSAATSPSAAAPAPAPAAAEPGKAGAAPAGPADGTAGEVRKIVGAITDSNCFAEGEAPSPEHAECAVQCIRGGAPIVLVEDGTGAVFVALAGKGKSLHPLLLPHVGRRVEVKGRVVRKGGTQFVIVESVFAEHEHTPHQGGAVAMAGDTHLELAVLRSGEVRLYLTDAFRRPLDARKHKARVTVARWGKTAPPEIDLVAADDGSYLGARLPPTQAREVEVTVHFPMADDPEYFMTFALAPVAKLTPRPTGPVPIADGDAPRGTAADPQGAGGAGAGAVAAKPGPAGEIKIEVDNGYSPERIELAKGVPTRLRFVRKNSSVCTDEILIPDLGVSQKLAALAETVVTVTPTKAGTFEMTCGMKMLRATVVVR